MKWKTPLQNSYRITQAKVDKTVKKFTSPKLSNPSKNRLIQRTDDAGDIPVSVNHHAIYKAKKQVVAVAKSTKLN